MIKPIKCSHRWEAKLQGETTIDPENLHDLKMMYTYMTPSCTECGVRGQYTKKFYDALTKILTEERQILENQEQSDKPKK